MEKQIVEEKLMEFIVENFLFGDTSRMPSEDDSLINTGIVDSTGILELIEFLEDTFKIEVAETETLPENLDSIGGLIRFVGRKPTHGASD